MPARKQVYVKAEKLQEGIILTDIKKKNWVVGELIGEGGFGHIYLTKQSDSKDGPYVVKIEPAENGPIFTEINFYKRVCTEKLIDDWMKKHNLQHLGVPRLRGCGVHDKFRFLVMDRFDKDLHCLMMKNSYCDSTLLQIAINIVDILEYIHNNDYVHADIKALNVMQDCKAKDKIYMLDFGMTSLYRTDDKHKPEKIDKRLKHNGTLEFCSRDSHRGVTPSRRSDMESLLFNLIYWLTWKNKNDGLIGYGKLPWINLVEEHNKTQNKNLLEKVYEVKEKYLSNADDFIKSVELNNSPICKTLSKMITYISRLDYQEEPDYDKMRRLLVEMIHAKDKIPTNINMNKYRSITWQFESTDTSTNKKAGRNLKRVSSDLEEKVKKKRMNRNGSKSDRNNNATFDSDDDLFESPSTNRIKGKSKGRAKEKYASPKLISNEKKQTATDSNSHNQSQSQSPAKSGLRRKKSNTNNLNKKEIIPGLKGWNRKRLSSSDPLNGSKEIIPGIKSIQRMKDQKLIRKNSNRQKTSEQLKGLLRLRKS